MPSSASLTSAATRVEPFERQPEAPLDRHPDPLEREAALTLDLGFVRAVDDARVHERLRAVLVVLEHEDALQEPDLGRGEPDALGVCHQLLHPLGKVGQVVVELGDLFGLHPERDVGVLADLGEGVAAKQVTLELGAALGRLVTVIVVIVVVVIVIVVVVVVVRHQPRQCASRRGPRAGLPFEGRPAGPGGRGQAGSARGSSRRRAAPGGSRGLRS